MSSSPYRAPDEASTVQVVAYTSTVCPLCGSRWCAEIGPACDCGEVAVHHAHMVCKNEVAEKVCNATWILQLKEPDQGVRALSMIVLARLGYGPELPKS